MASSMALRWQEARRRRIESAAAIRAMVILGIGADFVRFGEYTHKISEFVRLGWKTGLLAHKNGENVREDGKKGVLAHENSENVRERADLRAKAHEIGENVRGRGGG